MEPWGRYTIFHIRHEKVKWLHTVIKSKYSRLSELGETWSLLGLKMLCSTGICLCIEFRLNRWRNWETGGRKVVVVCCLLCPCAQTAFILLQCQLIQLFCEQAITPFPAHFRIQNTKENTGQTILQLKYSGRFFTSCLWRRKNSFCVSIWNYFTEVSNWTGSLGFQVPAIRGQGISICL